MKLTSIQLENIRSHVKTEIQFGDGFNCLVGGLGQGKSSVLYAFDFVLFGDPLGRSYDYLLREDAEKGRVTAFFVHNGKQYKIQRVLQRRGDGISQNIDNLKFYREGTLIASNKNEAVAEELTALIGLDKNIFREIVWVRQEHLKELLDTTPRQRQTKLDKLFGLSDYDVAWSELHQFEREYTVEKNFLERDVDVIRVSRLEDDYCATIEEFSSITQQLVDVKENLTIANNILNEANSRLESLEEFRITTEALRRKEIQLQTSLNNIKKRSSELLNQIETDKRRLDEQKGFIEKLEYQKKLQQETIKEEGLSPGKPLDQLRTYLFDLEERLRNISVEQEATQREMKDAIDKISSIITESRCPQCLQTISGDYKTSLKKTLQNEQNENEEKLKAIQADLEELKSHHKNINCAFSNLQQINPRIDDLAKQIEERQESICRFVIQIKEAEEEAHLLQNQLVETREDIAEFDITELDDSRKKQKDALENYFKVKHEMETLERKKVDLALRVDDLKERLEIVQKKIDRKENISKLLEIMDRIRIAYRGIQPKLRSEFVTYLQIMVQKILHNLTGGMGPVLNVEIDDAYSPFVSSEKGYKREVSNLSGGERTLLAFAYRIGLGQLIMQAKTGHGLYMLLLDEPTESLGREDGSVERLAEAISRLKSIEQIIAVTHNESFAAKAEHIIRIEKESGSSQVYIEEKK